MTDVESFSVREVTVLLAGLHVLDTSYDGSNHGVFPSRPGPLTLEA